MSSDDTRATLPGTDRDDLTSMRLRDDLLPGRTALPLPPLRFAITDAGSGQVLVTVVNDGPMGRLNGAVRFDVYFASDVDTTTAAGKAAGAARATCLAPSIPATNVDNTSSSGTFNPPTIPATSIGYFYVCGVDANGKRSAFSEPAKVTVGAIDTTVPGDVRHFQVSESGRVANGTVLSELSVTASPPDDTSNFGELQLYLKDYPGIGDIQEGYAHRWTGSGGIDFDVLYPIPRRKGVVAITATNLSTGVGAASGLLAIAQPGDSLELNGELVKIDAVTDTTLTLHANWPGKTITTTDYSIVARVTVYGVSVGKSGSRRPDVTNAPSVAVLMDGNISAPNEPAQIYLTLSGVSVLVEWDQVAGSTINGYNVYRSPGNSVDLGMLAIPPQPTLGAAILLGKVPQNPNLPVGSTYVRMQWPDSRFTPYDLEANNPFIWYVTTTNTRGDESAANYIAGNCQRAVTSDIDPTQTGRNPGKNYLYNAAMHGTAGNVVLANDVSQDEFMGTTGSDLPGKPYGAASGQANGTGKFRGYTRWEATDKGSGAANSVKFQNGDEFQIGAPGGAARWYVYEEIGAWDESSGNAFKKVGKGEVYALSFLLNHTGVTPNGTLSAYVEQFDNNTFKSECARRFRDTNSVITTTSTPLDIAGSVITATATQFQAAFQLDASISPTRQIRITFSWNGSAGVIVVRRSMLNPGEVAAQWTADMGDTNISFPTPTNPVDPLGDARTTRDGAAQRRIP